MKELTFVITWQEILGLLLRLVLLYLPAAGFWIIVVLYKIGWSYKAGDKKEGKKSDG